MPPVFERPVVHYGLSLINAAVVAGIGFTVFSGPGRLLVLVVALAEFVVVPQILKRAA
jgi:hypothetical protein